MEKEDLLIELKEHIDELTDQIINRNLKMLIKHKPERERWAACKDLREARDTLQVIHKRVSMVKGHIVPEGYITQYEAIVK